MADIKIFIIVRASTERGLALYQGASREYVDETTGEITTKEHWHWVAKSLVTRLDARPRRGQPELVRMPEWLAKEKGLL